MRCCYLLLLSVVAWNVCICVRRCSLFVVRCSWFVTCYLMFVGVCCLLLVVLSCSCLWCVVAVCCGLFVMFGVRCRCLLVSGLLFIV